MNEALAVQPGDNDSGLPYTIIDVIKREPGPEDREFFIREVGENTLLAMNLEEKISERSPGRLRSIARFIFRHGEWEDDQYWRGVYENGQDIARRLNLCAISMLQGRGSGTTTFYKSYKGVLGIDYFKRLTSQELKTTVDQPSLT